MASCCNLKVLFSVLVICCVFFIVSFVLAFVVFPIVIDNEINKSTKLEEGTEQYDRFVKLPFPLDFKVYIFNVENPDEVLAGTAKPRVTEDGPYVYKQYRQKTILDKNKDEDTISYTETERFEFDSEASGGLKENDKVTVLNAPLMAMYSLAEDFGLAGAVENCILPTFPDGYDKLFITVPVKQLLFDGVNFCNNNATGMCQLVNDIVCALAATKRNADVLPDYSLQFSLFNYKVKEPDGKYTVKRGLDDIDTLGHIIAWNDMKYTNYWGQGTTCSQVKGTDSTIYPPKIDKDNKFNIFATDICRYVEIDYKGEETYKDIDGYMFGTSASTVQSSTENPEDDCYCSMLSRDLENNRSCFLDGIVDMQTCFGVPVIFSFPHFLWASNPSYGNGVDGLNPDEENHKTYLIVEPHTGTPLRGVKRIQLNAAVRRVPEVKSLATVTKAMLPLVWIEEGVALPDKYVDELKSKYFNKVKIVDGVKWTLIALSSLLLVIFIGLLVRKKFFKK